MSKIKYALGAAGVSTALMLGLSGPVGAQATVIGDGNTTSTSVVTTYGDCSIVESPITATQDVSANGNADGDAGDGAANLGLGGSGGAGDNFGTGGDGGSADGDGGAGGSNNQSSTVATTQAVTMSVACNTTNVTNVTQQAAAWSAARQVQAPKGGVDAGAGAAAAPLAGFTGSLASLGYGLLQLRKRA